MNCMQCVSAAVTLFLRMILYNGLWIPVSLIIAWPEQVDHVFTRVMSTPTFLFDHVITFCKLAGRIAGYRASILCT